MKTCFKCGATKPLTEFYKHKRMADVHLNKCKTCTKFDVMTHRDANLEKVRAYDRERGKLPHRIASNVENTRRYRKENQKRYMCNNEVYRALREGSLKRMTCWACGSSNVEGHHPDYDAPLSVVWLCPAHHREIHLKHPR